MNKYNYVKEIGTFGTVKIMFIYYTYESII